MSKINSFMDDDVNWKFVDVPSLRDDGTLYISGEFELPANILDSPKQAYGRLSDTAEQVGGIVSKKDGGDVIKVVPRSEESYCIHYDGTGDMYKVTIHQGDNKIAQLTREELEERREISNAIMEETEFRGVYSDSWEDGDSRADMMDILYTRENQTDHGAYIEIDYKSERTGNTKTVKGEVLNMKENDSLFWEDVTTFKVSREDGKFHLLGFPHDSDTARLFSKKNENMTELGEVEAVYVKPIYSEPDWV